MPLFQKSVINKYLKSLDNDKVDKAFENFQKFYGNKMRLANIMQLKEENYQEGFLREIFVQTLGYIINPDENYNLTTEYKNQKDARKADGAIIRDGKAIGVIELKSTKTKNLESIREQAFSYKVNQPGCKYVITSNFQSLRFYVDNATEYEEFNLFQLTKQDFKLLYLLLSKESIFNDLPEKLKEETKFHEKNISDKLYEDYKRFKDQIFENLVKNNPQYDKLTLFKKSQKLLDRFLFVFFAEDSGLIPPNAVSQIIEQWKTLQELDEYKPLYSRFQKLFTHLDKGHTYKKWGEIPAYNGGLFRKDEILDSSNIKIDDTALEKDSLKISAYDFNTEVDVNILGHIFEHSLNEIEEITAEIHSGKIDKKKTKRKKDGIFYTPKYITKYIIENTVGKLCNKKKAELQIDNLLIDDYSYRKKDGKLNQKGKQLFDTINNYKNWLLTLKILDPACGSGAFLNQTLDFLIKEHKQADDLLAELTGDNLRLFDTDKAILENNIFGVDINDESVEIAKLSLWLHTAQKGRKLSDLSGNIKCGNSLIDDPEVAGNKTFNWNIEFREIMDNGGFDVIVGNPPYVRTDTLPQKNKIFYTTNWISAYKQYDLYVLFYELGIKLLKNNGLLSFITPNKFYVADYGKMCRKYILENSSVVDIADVSMMNIFPDASVYPTIITLKKQIDRENEIKIKAKIKDENELIQNKYETIKQIDYINADNNIINLNISNRQLILKAENQGQTIKNLFKITRGFRPPKDELLTKNKTDGAYPMIIGSALSKAYNINWDGNYVIYKPKEIPEAKAIEYFLQPKIFIRDIGLKFNAYFDNQNFLCLKTIYFIYGADETTLKYVTTLLNSKFLNFYFFEKYSAMHISGGYLRFRKQFIDNVPIKIIDNKQPYIEKADIMVSLNKELQSKAEKFKKRIKANLEVEKLTKKQQKFYNFDFKTFVAELKKQKIILNFKQQDEWEDYFDSYKQEINDLQHRINQTDTEIDKMVYELYKLTENEIETIENNYK